MVYYLNKLHIIDRKQLYIYALVYKTNDIKLKKVVNHYFQPYYIVIINIHHKSFCASVFYPDMEMRAQKDSRRCKKNEYGLVQ